MSGPPRPELRLIPGDGGHDIAELADELRDMVRAGELEMAIVVVLDRDGLIKHRIAWVDAMGAPWSRAYAALASVQHDLMEDGI